jgi:hypothetical protein
MAGIERAKPLGGRVIAAAPYLRKPYTFCSDQARDNQPRAKSRDIFGENQAMALVVEAVAPCNSSCRYPPRLTITLRTPAT